MDGPDREREILLFECECAAMFSDACAAANHEAATGHFVSTRRVPESMLANHEAVELSLLEALAAAPSEGVPEGRVEAMTLALYAGRALRTSIDLEVDVDDCVPHCDQLAHALFTAYGRGLVERTGAMWRLGAAGEASLQRAGLTPTVAAKTIAAEALTIPVAELLTEVAEKLSFREPAGRRSGGRVSGRNHRVFEDVGRSWKPEDYATDDHMNLVLEILIEHREVAQNEIVTLLHEELGDRYRLGTVRGIVSASLLYLREAGLVEVAQPSRPTTWRIT